MPCVTTPTPPTAGAWARRRRAAGLPPVHLPSWRRSWALLQEALVVAHHQLAVDLLDRLQGHLDEDEDGDAEEGQRLATTTGEELREEVGRDEGDDRGEQGAGEGDAV